MAASTVGIVVIGRNEGQRLVRCLESVLRLSQYIVYVDSGSSDDSARNAAQFGAEIVNLDSNRPFTAARARNAGFALAQQCWPDIKYVQFIDGDCELDNSWLPIATDFLNSRPDIAIVCGRRRERNPAQSFYNYLCDLEWDTAIGQTATCGGDMLARVDAVRSISGFRESLIAGEEPELCLRLRQNKWKIWRLDAEMSRHDAAMDRFGQWWKRCVRGGHAFVEVSGLHWRSPMGIWKREVTRAVVFGGVLPIIVAVAAVSHFAALCVLLIYPIQVLRIAIRRHSSDSKSWIYGIFVTLGKFAEFQGVLIYVWRRLNGRTLRLIEYK